MGVLQKGVGGIRGARLATMSASGPCSHRSCVESCARATLRAFLGGYGVKSAATLMIAIGTVRWSRVARERRRLLLNAFGLDSLRFAAFLGVMSGTFNGIMCALRARSKRHSPSHALIAGLVAGTALWLDSPSRRTEIALYSAARAAAVVWHAGEMGGLIPHIPYGSSILFGVLCCFIQYSYMYEPTLMEPAYFRWIDYMAHDTEHRMDKIFNYLRAKQGVVVGHGYYPGPYNLSAEEIEEVRAARERRESSQT